MSSPAANTDAIAQALILQSPPTQETQVLNAILDVLDAPTGERSRYDVHINAVRQTQGVPIRVQVPQQEPKAEDGNGGAGGDDGGWALVCPEAILKGSWFDPGGEHRGAEGGEEEHRVAGSDGKEGVGAVRYVDPKQRMTFEVSAHTERPTAINVAPLPPTARPTPEPVKMLQTRLDRYVRLQYPSDASVAAVAYPVFHREDGETEGGVEAGVTVVISAVQRNVVSAWSGLWTSRWHYDSPTTTLTGTVTLHTHFYEAGNVQLRLTATPPPTPTTIASMCDTIRTLEAQVHSHVLQTYHRLGGDDTGTGAGEGSLKRLRRALPVTKKKMDWDKIAAYTLSKDLPNAMAAHATSGSASGKVTGTEESAT